MHAKLGGELMRRRMMMHEEQCGELPSGYILCEYLESTGTQWIDTLVNSSPSIGFEARIKINNYTGKEMGVFGVSSQNGQIHSVLQVHNSALRLYATHSSWGTVNIATYISDNDIHVVGYNRKNELKKYLDGNETLPTYSIPFSDIDYPFWIFARNVGGNLYSSGALVNIYWFKIYDNGEVIREFIPVINTSGIPCMYDTVTKQTFYNQGTGEFGCKTLDGIYIEPV